MSRKQKTILFATIENVEQLIQYLFGKSDILFRVGRNQGFVCEAHRARINLKFTVNQWQTGPDCRSLEKCVERLNNWQNTFLTRSGHQQINTAFSKWRSARKRKVKKVDIPENLYDILKMVQEYNGYSNIGEAIEHVLPDKAERIMMQTTLAKRAEDKAIQQQVT